MYHTDYSSKLRKASRKSIKNLPRSKNFTPIIEDRTTHLHRAVVAAVLVIVAILQMDPANAEPTMDSGCSQVHWLGFNSLPMNLLRIGRNSGWQQQDLNDHDSHDNDYTWAHEICIPD